MCSVWPKNGCIVPTRRTIEQSFQWYHGIVVKWQVLHNVMDIVIFYWRNSFTMAGLSKFVFFRTQIVFLYDYWFDLAWLKKNILSMNAFYFLNFCSIPNPHSWKFSKQDTRHNITIEWSSNFQSTVWTVVLSELKWKEWTPENTTIFESVHILQKLNWWDFSHVNGF